MNKELAEQTAREVYELKWGFGFTEKQLTPVIKQALDQARAEGWNQRNEELQEQFAKDYEIKERAYVDKCIREDKQPTFAGAIAFGREEAIKESEDFFDEHIIEYQDMLRVNHIEVVNYGSKGLLMSDYHELMEE